MEVENRETGLSPEKVVEILRKHGEAINLEDAKTIAKLIHYFTNIAVNQLTKAEWYVKLC